MPGGRPVAAGRPRDLVPAVLVFLSLVAAPAFAETLGRAPASAGATPGQATLSPRCPAGLPTTEEAVDSFDSAEAKDATPAPAIAPSVRVFDRRSQILVDPSLEERGSGSLAITGSLVKGTLAAAPAAGFELDDALCMLPTHTTPAEREATIVNGDSALHANSAPGTDTIVRPTATGVAVVVSRRGANAPTSFAWKVGVPAGYRLRALSNGGVAIEDPYRAAPASDTTPHKPASVERIEAISDAATQLAEGRYEIANAEREIGNRVLSVMTPPYAVDSDGHSAPATLSTDGADGLTISSSPRARAVVLTVATRPAKARTDAPIPVNAYPIMGLPGNLATEAANAACSFARSQPRGKRLMILHFGRAYRHHAELGAGRRPFRSNAEILAALKAAAASYRKPRCHRPSRKAIIAFGLGNYKSSVSGDDGEPMTAQLGEEIGAAQWGVARRLRQSLNAHDDAALAGDIEPGWDPSDAGVLVGKALVRGAATHRFQYYNFGTAGHCPPYAGPDPGCGSWGFRDLGVVSQRDMTTALPEIYYAYQARQWARVRKRWDGRQARRCWRHRSSGCYSFAGATSEPKVCGADLSPARSWITLRDANPPGSVARELVYYNPERRRC
jgi:hypothetical protein